MDGDRNENVSWLNRFYFQLWSFWGKGGKLCIFESFFWTTTCKSSALITVIVRTKLLTFEGFLGGTGRQGTTVDQGAKKFAYQARLVLCSEAKGCIDKEVIKTVIQII